LRYITRDVSIIPAEGSPYEKTPPWLVSTILHLAVLIGLALISIGRFPEAGYELVLAPNPSLAEEDLDLGAAPAVEILVAESGVSAAIEDLPIELPSEDLLEQNLGDLFATESVNATHGLLRGFGEDLAGKGGPVVTSVFGLSGEGSKFVYVFDRSDSMNSVFRLYSQDALVSEVTPLGLAKTELLHSLRQLADRHQFQIVFYNFEPRLFGDGYYGDHNLYPANSENKRRASEFIEEIVGVGGTNHWAALQAALPLRPDVIFLITDGLAKDDPPLSRVHSMANLCRRKRIKVNVIHFSNFNRSNCTLIPLAEETHGQHLFVDLKTLVRAAGQP
jgi:hypothetical protein